MCIILNPFLTMWVINPLKKQGCASVIKHIKVVNYISCYSLYLPLQQTPHAGGLLVIHIWLDCNAMSIQLIIGVRRETTKMECFALIFYHIWTFENGKIKPSSLKS
jgi:hypothetical protein